MNCVACWGEQVCVFDTASGTASGARREAGAVLACCLAYVGSGRERQKLVALVVRARTGEWPCPVMLVMKIRVGLVLSEGLKVGFEFMRRMAFTCFLLLKRDRQAQEEGSRESLRPA